MSVFKWCEMFEKFFGACTITFGLYLCLRLSNVIPGSSPILMFKLSQLEHFSWPTLQESVKSGELSKLRSRTALSPKVIAY
ncbi:hypothetical protein [Crocosphaera sp. XPORK-15E]|uniref:hypothetical protein n=1 Tax=Crocosphaera sp. XPORK-15E TaxID=3110247 RepID=UPI002B1F3527|nr:hypothetical protein [Crocosphaera sp. XPORK-15E]MEA5533701.1 hypothetical protein [Crocosphaera sp. XPORK-15E]